MKPIFFALRAAEIPSFSDTIAFFISYPVAAYLTYKYGVIGFAVPIGTYLSFAARYFYLKKKEPLLLLALKIYLFGKRKMFIWRKEFTNQLK